MDLETRYTLALIKEKGGIWLKLGTNGRGKPVDIMHKYISWNLNHCWVHLSIKIMAFGSQRQFSVGKVPCWFCSNMSVTDGPTARARRTAIQPLHCSCSTDGLRTTKNWNTRRGFTQTEHQSDLAVDWFIPLTFSINHIHLIFFSAYKLLIK